MFNVTKNGSEITITKNGKVIAQMVDYRDLGMGIAPYKLNGISELTAIYIIESSRK